jgi:hypothetical protein
MELDLKFKRNKTESQKGGVEFQNNFNKLIMYAATAQNVTVCFIVIFQRNFR